MSEYRWLSALQYAVYERDFAAVAQGADKIDATQLPALLARQLERDPTDAEVQAISSQCVYCTHNSTPHSGFTLRSYISAVLGLNEWSVRSVCNYQPQSGSPCVLVSMAPDMLTAVVTLEGRESTRVSLLPARSPPMGATWVNNDAAYHHWGTEVLNGRRELHSALRGYRSIAVADPFTTGGVLLLDTLLDPSSGCPLSNAYPQLTPQTESSDEEESDEECEEEWEAGRAEREAESRRLKQIEPSRCVAGLLAVVLVAPTQKSPALLRPSYASAWNAVCHFWRLFVHSGAHNRGQQQGWPSYGCEFPFTAAESFYSHSDPYAAIMQLYKGQGDTGLRFVQRAAVFDYLVQIVSAAAGHKYHDWLINSARPYEHHNQSSIRDNISRFGDVGLCFLRSVENSADIDRRMPGLGLGRSSGCCCQARRMDDAHQMKVHSSIRAWNCRLTDTKWASTPPSLIDNGDTFKEQRLTLPVRLLHAFLLGSADANSPVSKLRTQTHLLQLIASEWVMRLPQHASNNLVVLPHGSQMGQICRHLDAVSPPILKATARPPTRMHAALICLEGLVYCTYWLMRMDRTQGCRHTHRPESAGSH